MITKSKGIPAFTLVEMMIAIAIFGIILIIAIPNLMKVRETAQLKKAQSDLELIGAAVKQLAWDTGMWPGGRIRTDRNYECWDLTTSAAGIMSRGSMFPSDKWKGPYLDELPNDPWGNRYFFDPDYERGGENHVVVASRGPNGLGPGPMSVGGYDSDDVIVIVHCD